MIRTISIEDIPNKSSRYLDIIKDIEEFLASGASAAEVTVSPQRKPQNVGASYRNAAMRSNYAVSVIQRDSRVFLLRKDLEHVK